ncbi:FAD-binding oxidoreductase [Aliigemmobacter aestuarii]|uniref:FAD-binding oxidoreductase n=1 Tax=Aliigemmobacter aestuarii TaxID=1445661 RepID=A0A4S3MNY1_9RHOB|nr:FAD-dependent oxidoreductase [Gemmobacter aestuarii]THD83425.1 FAD-binding oxidoreductase [Gemmobacter aestuarii]
MEQDFLIIGGGIAGLSAGAELAALGRVLVLEAEAHVAHHASGRSAALYEPRYGLPPVVELSLASEPAFRADPMLLSDRGLLILAQAGQRAAFEKDLAGFQLQEITPAEAKARVPIVNMATTAYAGVADHAWDIDTDYLLQAHVKRIRAKGGRVETGARVTAVAREGAGWRVTTATGQAHSARMIVNAGGAWADTVAGMAGVKPIGLQPNRRSMARIPAPGGLDVSRWPMMFGSGESWYAKPDAGALIVSPAEEHPMDPHDAWADDMVLAEGLARYEEMVTEPVTRMIANWAGLRTFSPDRVLVIGPDPREPSFFWVAGQGGYGFQTSPAASRLVADRIAGRTPDLPPALVAALDPARFG